ncbi:MULTISPECIES: DUF2783 domain-containing protein [Paenalcaligenes]|uniref:DUF2783 domain-containing protein n=1 Tax=Paenalcaligenes hermetiae TaxID=1157987 RepID=A0ABP9M1A7_9BURK|nr:DUF2783 domain-containing protein [Paenalcaligenes sp.]
MLNTDLNIEQVDEFYAQLIEAHEDLSTSQSHAMNAALVLLLSNHIGKRTVLENALQIARQTALTSD